MKKKKYVYTKARKKALNKARSAWKKMSPVARRKAMPSKVKHPKKVYPEGQYMMLDVGRKGHHVQFVKKVKYGWKKAEAPKSVRKFETKKGYINLTPEVRKLLTKKARTKWHTMTPKERAKAMPSWSMSRKKKVRRMRKGGMKG